jgi:hypothetical protein
MGKCKSSIFYELSCSDGFEDYRIVVEKQKIKVSLEETKKKHNALKQKYNKSSSPPRI